jgi:hypothetical protein
LKVTAYNPCLAILPKYQNNTRTRCSESPDHIKKAALSGNVIKLRVKENNQGKAS